MGPARSSSVAASAAWLRSIRGSCRPLARARRRQRRLGACLELLGRLVGHPLDVTDRDGLLRRSQRALRLFAKARIEDVGTRLPRLGEQDRELVLAAPARDVAPPRDAREQLRNLIGLRRATRGRRLRVRCRCRRARRRAGARCGVPEPPRVRARPRSHGGSRFPSRDRGGAAPRRRRSGARLRGPSQTSARSSFNADTCSGRNACGAVAYATSVPGTPALDPSGATSAEWKRSSSGSPAAL